MKTTFVRRPQFDDALQTCDRMTTYRQICAEVARQRGLIACFMAKPYMGYAANGCHHNCSLWTGGQREVQQLTKDDLPGMEENWEYSVGAISEMPPRAPWSISDGSGRPSSVS